MNKEVIVIGAGPAGLTAAYTLSKKGFHVRVYEASESVGGLAKTVELWNQKVDLGPHRFFSKDKRVNELWLEVIRDEYRMVNRLTRIFYDGKFYNYPLQVFNALFNMGLWNACSCFFSYLTSKFKDQKETKTFESWVTSRFGKKLYNMFFKTYSEKLWGISCTELDSDFAAQRIKKFSLGEAIKSAFGLDKKKHKTLVDQFAYPIGGSGVVYEKMAAKIVANGGEIHLSTPIAEVSSHEGQVTSVTLKTGETLSADWFISTMPLTLLAKSVVKNHSQELTKAIASLTYRNTLLVYLNIQNKNLFPDQWLYVHSQEIGFGRICNFRNWVPQLYGSEDSSILSLEYWCYNEDPIWNEDESELINRATTDLVKTGLAKKEEVVGGKVIKIPRCYPVYKTDYKEHVSVIVEHISKFENLIPIGRYGSFKYNNQDHSILMGLLAAENIEIGQKKNDLWAVNTDYEDYQESATISEKGLEELVAD